MSFWDTLVQLKLLNVDGTLSVMGGRDLVVPGEQLAQTSVLMPSGYLPVTTICCMLSGPARSTLAGSTTSAVG